MISNWDTFKSSHFSQFSLYTWKFLLSSIVKLVIWVSHLRNVANLLLFERCIWQYSAMPDVKNLTYKQLSKRAYAQSFSFFCTAHVREVSNISPHFLSHYTKYFYIRDALVDVYARFSSNSLILCKQQMHCRSFTTVDDTMANSIKTVQGNKRCPHFCWTAYSIICFTVFMLITNWRAMIQNFQMVVLFSQHNKFVFHCLFTMCNVKHVKQCTQSAGDAISKHSGSFHNQPNWKKKSRENECQCSAKRQAAGLIHVYAKNWTRQLMTWNCCTWDHLTLLSPLTDELLC